MVIVFLLVVLLIFAPGDLNDVVGLVVDPRNDYSSQQCLLNVGMEVLVSWEGREVGAPRVRSRIASVRRASLRFC